MSSYHSQRCSAGVVVLCADTDQEAQEWVAAINRDLGNIPPPQPVVPQQAPSAPQPIASVHHQQCQSVFISASPTNVGSPVAGSPQQKCQTNMSSSPNACCDVTGNDISPETFWGNVFGKLEEAPWPKLVDELGNALGINLRSDEFYAPFYCIANVVAEGCLFLAVLQIILLLNFFHNITFVCFIVLYDDRA